MLRVSVHNADQSEVDVSRMRLLVYLVVELLNLDVRVVEVEVEFVE